MQPPHPPTSGRPALQPQLALGRASGHLPLAWPARELSYSGQERRRRRIPAAPHQGRCSSGARALRGGLSLANDAQGPTKCTDLGPGPRNALCPAHLPLSITLPLQVSPLRRPEEEAEGAGLSPRRPGPGQKRRAGQGLLLGPSKLRTTQRRSRTEGKGSGPLRHQGPSCDHSRERHTGGRALTQWIGIRG